jgi:hypothetical protein
MPAATFDPKNFPETEEDIDFTDIEQAYPLPEDAGFDSIVVVDNVPVVDQSKEEIAYCLEEVDHKGCWTHQGKRYFYAR